MRPPRLTLPRTAQAFLPFQGGLDRETPPWQIRPGFLRDAQNYEVGIHGGYQDIQGYERFDGHVSPSEQIYQILEATITGSIANGDTVSGATSGATAVVLRVVDSDHADYSDTTYLVVAKVSGTFEASEVLQVAAADQAIADSTNQPSAARTTQLHARYLALAADEYRGDIGAVPGQGSVWGVFRLGGIWHAIRDKTGGVTAGLYKESSVGWTEVDLGRALTFNSGGTYEIVEGDVISESSTSATATVERVILTSGDWADGDAAGTLILSGQTGSFASSTLDVGANTNVADIVGTNSQPITIAPGGRLSYDKSSIFSGGTGERVYGAYGTGAGFEFDGTVFRPIETGMDDDTPDHVIVHQGHLFFAFGPSVQHSAVGEPFEWSPIVGAGEINVGDPVTGFNTEPGEFDTGALSIFSQNRIHILYGTSSADWQLQAYREEVGAFAHAVQQFGQTLFLHERGVMGLRTVQAFGNFADNTYTNHIQSWLLGRVALVTGSCVVRNKSQFRLFFSDTWALYTTMVGNKAIGVAPIKLDHGVSCIASEENSDGTEEILFGSTDGFVYQMDKGTSFDGGNIQAFMALHFFYPENSIGWYKRWLLASLEVRGEGYAEFQFAPEIAYGDAIEAVQPLTATRALDFSSDVWGQFVWDQFVWDSRSLNPSRVQLSGESENISLVIRKDSNYMQPVRFSGALLRYAMRARQIRS